MADKPIDLSLTNAAESIPDALAAPKRQRRAPAVTAPVATSVVLPSASEPPSILEPVVAETPAAPTAAASAEPQQEHDTVATTVENVTNQAEKLGETTKNAAQTMFADAKERTEDAVAKGQKFWAEMAEFNKGNVEALVESGRVAARGFEQMGREAAEEARKSFEATQAAVKTLASVKSPTEFVRLQGEFARTAFDQMVAQTSRNTESMLKLAGEIAQPISNRVALAADKMKVAA